MDHTRDNMNEIDIAQHEQHSELVAVDGTLSENLSNTNEMDVSIIERNIRNYEAIIEKLNKATFQDPNTRQRPPTEYLEIFNIYTEQIHKLQLKMNEAASRNKERIKESCSESEPLVASQQIAHSEHFSDGDDSIKSPRSPTPYSPISSSSRHTETRRLYHFHSFDETKDSSQIASPLPLAAHQQTLLTPSNASTSTIPTCGSGTGQSAFPFPAMYIKVFFGNHSAVIQKKNMMLKDALANKLKRFNLEVSRSVAYVSETNRKVDWDTVMLNIDSSSLVVAEYENVMHCFDKKTLSWRTCSTCKKRDLLNLYVCSKCELIMCQKVDCRIKSEQTVCTHKKMQLRTQTSSFTFADIASHVSDKKTKNVRSKSVQRDFNAKVNMAPLTVNYKFTVPPARDRSHSETFTNFNSVSDKIKSGAASLKKDSAYASAVSGIKAFNSEESALTTTSSREDVVCSSSDEVKDHVFKKPTSLVIPRKTDPEKRLTKKQLSLPSRRDSFISWEIPYTQINIDLNHKVGQGSFGIVHQGKDFYHGKVAIKFLNVQNPTPAQEEAFKNEVIILKLTRHDNILLFIGCILKPYLAIVTEWCSGSSLYRHLHVEEEHWEIGQLINIGKQTAAGMSYLHGRDILHRDLKSNNIFLIPKEKPNYHGGVANKLNKIKGLENDQHHEKWTVKIGDFGLATVKANWEKAQLKSAQPTGSILWMAPEVITQKVPDPYTQKSDVYSFGVVLYELFTGHLPYLKKEQNMILYLVGTGRLKLNPEDTRHDTPIEIKNLISTCSEFDRTKRLNFTDVNKILLNLKFYDHKLKRTASMPDLEYHYGY